MSFLWHGLTEQGAQVPVQVDAQGRVIAVDGTPGVSNWDRTNGVLSPAVPTDSVDIGSGNITLNANGHVKAGRFETTGGFNPGFIHSDGTKAVFAVYNDAIKLGTAADINAQPNITLFASGRGRFIEGAFKTDVGTNISHTCNNTELSGRIIVSNSDIDSDYFAGRVFEVKADGTTYFGGSAGTGAGVYDRPNITLNANGSIYNTKTYQLQPSSVIAANADLIYVNPSSANAANDFNFLRFTVAGLNDRCVIKKDGSAEFAGNITAPNVTFRSADPQFYVKKSKNKDASPEYVGPELDLLAEIARLEALVRHLYETLRLAPPAGFPVWDGNDDDVLRQLRK